MLDFTSSLYLGFSHTSSELPGWSSFTSGVPAALREPLEADWLKKTLARLLRCQATTLAPSTLHIFTDLSSMLSNSRLLCFYDAGTYPIVRVSLQRVACRNASIFSFSHHDPEDLERTIRRQSRREAGIIVISDAFCTDCGTAAPLADYIAIARNYDGRLLLDDSQGLGIFGETPSATDPYGVGGGGTPLLMGVSGPDVLVASSLSKAFGVPIALLAGAHDFIDQYEALSLTRVHSSPPSMPSIQAGAAALLLNERFGDARRRKLAMAVSYLRELLAQAGFSLIRSLFPLQTVFPRAGETAVELYRRLERSGVAAVLTKASASRHPRLRLVVTAKHETRDIDQVVMSLSSSDQRSQLRHLQPELKQLHRGIERAFPSLRT